VLIASRDSDLRLGLHVAWTNALPDAEFSIVRGDEELRAVASSRTAGGIVVIDVRISVDTPTLVSGSTFAGSQVVVLGDEVTLAAADWPPEVRTISTRLGTRAVIDAVLAASRR
jgi:hypothetical protein